MALLRCEIKLDAKLHKWLSDEFPETPRSHIVVDLLQHLKSAMDRGLTYQEVLLHLEDL